MREALTTARPQRWAAVAVFGLTWATYLASPVMPQSDSLWSVPTALSLVLEGDADLDEYGAILAARGHYGVIDRDGHAYSTFPLGPSLLAVPFVAALVAAAHLAPVAEGPGPPAWWREAFTGRATVDPSRFRMLERFVASLATSLAAVLVFLFANRRAGMRAAVAAWILFAFGTSAFSTASRVLWQHGPSLLALAGVVYLASSERLSRRGSVLLGIAVAAAFVFRPTNGITVVLIAALVLLRRRSGAAPFLGGAALIGLPWIAFNFATLGAALPPYYLPERLEPGERHLADALVGNLISPSRGLFVFSPFLLWSFLYAARAARRGRFADFEWAFAAAIVLHWLVISSFPHWWGGHSIGPRLFTDALPYLTWFLLDPLADALRPGRHRPGFAAALLATAAAGVAIHAHAATDPAVHGWNTTPRDVDEAPGRIWDWRDPQFLRHGTSHGPPTGRILTP